MSSNMAREVRKIPNVSYSQDRPKWAYIQALLSRGDRRVADVLEDAHRRGGNWTQALRHAAVSPDFFVIRDRGKSELLPWDFIDTGLGKERLWRQYRRALRQAAETEE